MQVITKISVKSCEASPELELVMVDGKQVPRAKGEQHLLRIIGVTNGIKRGTSDFGAWIAFLGSFEGTNMKTGEVYRSSKCLMPESITGLLSIAVGDSNNQVEFGVDIGCKPATTPTGYEYTVRPLVETTSNDPLALLKQRIGETPAGQLALPTGVRLPEGQISMADATAEAERAAAELKTPAPSKKK